MTNPQKNPVEKKAPNDLDQFMPEYNISHALEAFDPSNKKHLAAFERLIKKLVKRYRYEPRTILVVNKIIFKKLKKIKFPPVFINKRLNGKKG